MTSPETVRPEINLHDFVDCETNEHTHDQLPNVDEYKVGASGPGCSPQCKRSFLIVLTCLLASIALVTVGIVIGKDSATSAASSNTVPSEPASTDPPEKQSRKFAVIAFVVEQGWSNKVDAQTPRSPQFEAATWIGDYDPQALPIEDSLEFRQRYATAVFFYALGGDDWNNQLKFLSAGSVCDWNQEFQTTQGISVALGVSCKDGDTVKQIYIPSNNLNGQMPPELRLLSELESIDLHDNKISGVFPPVIHSFSQLKSLILHNNTLTGTLPGWIGDLANLGTLNVADNGMGGPVPSSISKLDKLITLDLERNKFNGTLDVFQDMTMLQALLLGDNEFTGDLENEVLMSWFYLQVLDASNNKLSGNLPNYLFAMDNLLVVDLHGNGFDGELPEVWSPSTKLFFLALHQNALSGPLDERIWQMTTLEHLDLSENGFTGPIPPEIGELSNLKYLFLAYCDKLQPGRIPTEVGRLTHLVDLSFQGTNRTGEIPTVLGDLETLRLLDVNNNELEGNIPTELGRLEDLNFLLLKGNKLSGSIPFSFVNFRSLEKLIIDDNNLSGSAAAICAPKLPKLTQFFADCGDGVDLVSCPCCTACCQDADVTCNNHIYLANQDPVADYDYFRHSYIFYDQDIIYPTEPPM